MELMCIDFFNKVIVIYSLVRMELGIDVWLVIITVPTGQGWGVPAVSFPGAFTPAGGPSPPGPQPRARWCGCLAKLGLGGQCCPLGLAITDVESGCPRARESSAVLVDPLHTLGEMNLQHC